MTSTMKDWITPAAVDELSGAFETLRSEYTSGETLHKHPYECSPAAVTVHLQKGRRVQLIEFNGRTYDPFDVTLSDGTTRIRATFTAECATEFGTGRDAVQNALGAVLAIQEYYLNYKPSSPRSERLTLRVTKFKILGSHGERVFGQPKDIDEQESLWDVLTGLDNVLAGSESNNTNGLDEELDIRSQAGDMEDQQSSPIASMATQTAFGTQVPAKTGGSSFQSALDIPKNLSVVKGADFLALLDVSKEKAVAAETMSGATTSRFTTNAQTKSVLQPVSETRKVEMSSKLESKANSQSSVPVSDSKEYAIPPKESIPPLSSHLISDDGSEKENSQESLEGPDLRPIHSHQEAEPVTKANQKGVSDVLIAQISEDNPFEGMKRVPKSYVRIPANQQALLESKDSWWQPESGSRATYANLPLEVAEGLNSFIDRREHGRKRQVNDGAGSTADRSGQNVLEESEDDENEEVSEDDVGELDDVEQNVPQLEESKETAEDDSMNDEESVVSWAESNYGDPEADNFEAAPDPTHEDLVDTLDVNGTSIAPDLPSARKSIPQSPLAPNMSVAPKPKARIDYNFPSSSPGDEEELEMVVPYAIDDQVDEDVAENAEESKTSQELPSTAVANQTVIQVEQTPNHNATREARDFGTGKQPDPKHHKRVFTDAKTIDGHVSSDPVIPATLHDSSQDRLSSPKERHPASSEKPSGPVNSATEEEQFSLEEHDPVVEAHDVVQEQDEMIEEQLFTELKSSQLRRNGAFGSSPSFPLDRKTSKITVQSTPTKNKMPGDVSPPLRSPQQPNSSSFHTALSEIRSETDRPSSSPVKAEFLKQNERPQPEVRKLKGPAAAKYLTAVASQTHSGFRELVDWTRAARHSFDERDFWPIGEVQVAQSQPNPSATEQSSLSHPSADTTFARLSKDFVRSTIPERTEEIAAADYASEDLPTSPSKEPSPPAVLDQPQLSPRRKVIEFSKSRSISPMESVRRADGHTMAVFIPRTQDSEQNSVEHEADNKVDVVSISSASDEKDLADEEEALGGYAVTEEEEEEEIADDEKMIDATEQTDAVDAPQATETQQDRNPSPEPTAFHKFKSIYPSYSGKEKNFVWALVYIEWLVETKGEDFLRASLWDDFIRTLAVEYMEYVKEVRGSKDRIRTGFQYFNRLDKPPIFQQRIMTPDNLRESLSTLDPAKVEKVRLLFNKSTPPMADHWQSSHDHPSDASKTSQNDETQEKTIADVVINPAGRSRASSVPEARILEAPERTSTKRPFFETASQLQAAKKPRTVASPKGQCLIEAPRSSKSRRSLPWTQTTVPPSPPNPTSLDRPTISAPAALARIDTTSAIPGSKQRSTNSTSLNVGSPASPILGNPGPRPRSFDVRDIRSKSNQASTSSTSLNRDSPGSPILGDPGFKSRSFDMSDIRTGSMSSSPSFKKLSAPVSKAALMQQCSLPRSKEGKVEGWLDDTEADDSHKLATPIAVTKIPPRKDSIKRKRESGLELLDMQTLSSEVKSRRVASPPISRAVASSLTSRLSNATSGTAEVRRKMSFREFLQKKRRESEQASILSTPDSKAASVSGKRVERTSVQHAEPETQAWGV